MNLEMMRYEGNIFKNSDFFNIKNLNFSLELIIINHTEWLL